MSVTANFAINTYTLTYTAGAQRHDHAARRRRRSTTAAAARRHGRAEHRLPLRQLERRRADGRPRTDTNVTANMSVTANFAINTYTLTYTAGADGTITRHEPADGEPRRQRHGGDGGAEHRLPLRQLERRRD